MLNRPIQKFSSHPLATGFKLVSLIAGTELLVMLAFSFLEIDQWMSPRMTSITNALVSGISGAFMIFYWVVRPIKTGAESSCVEKDPRESEMLYKHLFKSAKDFREYRGCQLLQAIHTEGFMRMAGIAAPACLRPK